MAEVCSGTLGSELLDRCAGEDSGRISGRISEVSAGRHSKLHSGIPPGIRSRIMSEMLSEFVSKTARLGSCCLSNSTLPLIAGGFEETCSPLACSAQAGISSTVGRKAGIPWSCGRSHPPTIEPARFISQRLVSIALSGLTSEAVTSEAATSEVVPT